jgi:hypothetical protein
LVFADDDALDEIIATVILDVDDLKRGKSCSVLRRRKIKSGALKRSSFLPGILKRGKSCSVLQQKTFFARLLKRSNCHKHLRVTPSFISSLFTELH